MLLSLPTCFICFPDALPQVLQAHIIKCTYYSKLHMLQQAQQGRSDAAGRYWGVRLIAKLQYFTLLPGMLSRPAVFTVARLCRVYLAFYSNVMWHPNT